MKEALKNKLCKQIGKVQKELDKIAHDLSNTKVDEKFKAKKAPKKTAKVSTPKSKKKKFKKLSKR